MLTIVSIESYECIQFVKSDACVMVCLRPLPLIRFCWLDCVIKSTTMQSDSNVCMSVN